MEKEIIQISVQEEEERRIDRFIAEHTDFSRSYVQRLIKDNQVSVNGKSITKVKIPVSFGDEIEVIVPEPEQLQIEPEQMDLDILYEDSDVIVVNKPKDMVVHPAAGHMKHTLVNGLLYHCQGNLSGINGVMRPGIVHRIDKDTTGSLVVCKNDDAHIKISEQIKAHTMTRQYRGIVIGRVKEETGSICMDIGRDPKNRLKMAANVPNGRSAVTHYRVLERFSGHTYMAFQLETGRTHQIRVHMAAIGHPILGDPLYGPQKPKFRLEGQCLHAMTLGFIHPRSGERIEVTAPLPAYFEKLLACCSL